MSNKITVNIGFGNSVVKRDITAVIQPNSAPVKRFIKQKQEEARVIDATMGKRLRAVVVLSSGYVILSGISPTSLVSRIEDE
ncbi:MAG: DUF370 domain-containing protein [bacterium]|nr:DUF370 domain-containing protein [bacterium]